MGDVLDALASFCVSEPKGESVALSLETSQDVMTYEELVKFVLATNPEVSPATKQHLEDIWRSMQRIASVYHSQGPNVNSGMRMLLDDFAQLCLEFSFEKWKKRVNSSSFYLGCARAEEHVKRLLEICTCTEPEIGKPDTQDKWKWKQFAFHLRETQMVIESLLYNGLYAGFHGLDRRLRKIISPIHQLDVLWAAIKSPQCKHLFLCPVYVRSLSSMPVNATTTAFHTAEYWEIALEKAASIHHNEYTMDMWKVSEDTRHMARKPIMQNSPAHCELKLVLDAMQLDYAVYTYIGVFKPSCPGCQIFLRALNDVHDTSFCMRGLKGLDAKRYYPWQFPDGVSRRDEVVQQAYQYLADSWVPTYGGYIKMKTFKPPGLITQSVFGFSTDEDHFPSLVAQL